MKKLARWFAGSSDGLVLEVVTGLLACTARSPGHEKHSSVLRIIPGTWCDTLYQTVVISGERVLFFIMAAVFCLLLRARGEL